MKFFEVKNAARTIQLGPNRLSPEPIVLVSGSWMGVLKVPDHKATPSLLEHPRIVREMTEAEYLDLKKKRRESLRTSEVVEPEQPDAAPAEKEKPSSVEEVLLEGRAEIKDPLSDAKPKKRTRVKKK